MGPLVKQGHLPTSPQAPRNLRNSASLPPECGGAKLSKLSRKRWRKNLSFDEDQKLRLYRGGCGPSETRRGAVRTRAASNSISRADYDGFVCPWCGAPAASVRHMWAECPNFQDLREELQVLHNIPEAWWSAQPRVTAKSGWVTVGAHPDPRRRVTLQIAACHLGIQVLEAYFHTTKFTSGCRGMDVDFDAPRPADAHLR